MKTLTKLEEVRLRMEAEKHVSQLNYHGLCQLVPRAEHWFEAYDETRLHNLQRETAIKRTFERLSEALRADKV